MGSHKKNMPVQENAFAAVERKKTNGSVARKSKRLPEKERLLMKLGEENSWKKNGLHRKETPKKKPRKNERGNTHIMLSKGVSQGESFRKKRKKLNLSRQQD